MRAHLRVLGDDTTTVILSGIENCAGVISACLPTMLPIWNFLRHGRAQTSAKSSVLIPVSGQYTGPKNSNMKTPLWNAADASVKPQDGPFQRLREEREDELDDAKQPTRPAMAIRVTTNIEMSQKMPPLGTNINTYEARQPGW